MSSSRLAVFSSFLVLVALSSACSGTDEPSELGGTGPDDGKFVPPPTKPEDGQKSSTGDGTAAKKEAPPASTPTPPATMPLPTGAAGSCAAPQCFGIAGLCGCRGGSEGKQTIMGCSGGNCRCNDKTLPDDGACGATANVDKLKVLFASCGCQ